MLPAYKKILQQSISQKEETKKFLRKIKRSKPNDLDSNCNTLHYKAFENIDCLQCANCCITTGPLLLHKDIERLSQSLSVRQAAFTNQYLRQDEDGDLVFKNMPCPFLDEHNYCNVYEARPNACREYPHTQQRKIINKLDITFHNSTICPAVAKVVEGLKKIYGNT